MLANSEDDRLADFPADRVAERIFQKCLAKHLIGGFGKEELLKFTLLVNFLLVVALVNKRRAASAPIGALSSHRVGLRALSVGLELLTGTTLEQARALVDAMNKRIVGVIITPTV
jgi:hypothetical protein